MNYQRHQQRPWPVQFVRGLRFWRLALPACLLVFAVSAFAQQESEEPPPGETAASHVAPDPLLPQITAAIQGVTTRDVGALSAALHIEARPEGADPGAPLNSLAPVGDVDGDGVPELILQWAIPNAAVGADLAPDPDSLPLWGVYLLSWDGAHWKASTLVTGVEHCTPGLINLGPRAGRGLALVIREADAQGAYPVIFQVKDHAATLVWDGQGDNSRYEPLLQGRVTFQEHSDAPAEMVATGRADPGLLQVEPTGRRGFDVRVVYRWDGKSFVPVKAENFADEDYTVYRFISALHLHDYRSAFALVDPAKFLKTDSPTLDAFRKFIEDNLPEFLEDAVFVAPEPPAGAADEHVFVLPQGDKRYVYHPIFAGVDNFLLIDLTRTQEAVTLEP